MEIEPTITEKDLAEMERGHVALTTPLASHQMCRRDSFWWPCPTVRLIAALRAEREQVAKLEAEVDHWQGGCNPHTCDICNGR